MLIAVPPCENTLGMRGFWIVVSTVLLSLIALISTTFSLSALWVLRSGNWQYPELIAPIGGLAATAILALAAVALINRRKRGANAIIRLAGLLTAGCFAASACLFFALIGNCSLSCQNRTVTELRSPDGRWKAVAYSRECRAIVGFCPSVSHVSVLGVDERLPDGVGNAFSVAGVFGTDLRWQSGNILSVGYSGIVLRQRQQVEKIRIEYRLIGIL
jgi:hypothetical protein